jgi:mRNA-degrading endonuclease RelE of RelBE toxin-antitoxin system
MWQIDFYKDAKEELFNLPVHIRPGIFKKIEDLKNWPELRLFEKPLTGFKPNIYIIKYATYRIAFYRKSKNIIEIICIAERSKVYVLIKRKF